VALFLAKRFALGLATVFIVSVLAFLLVHAGSTSPGVVALGMGGTPEEIRAFNESIGWYDPLIDQYLRWIGAAVQGNFGTSLIDGRNIFDDILIRLPVTTSLAAGATIVSAIVGIVFGVTAAVRRGFTVFIFAVQSSIFPATGYVPFATSPSLWAMSLALPVLTLTIGGAAFIARQTRASMNEALAQEHIRTLRATGTPTWRILYVHALRFASLPIIASIALQFIALFGGSVIIEQLFAMPGMGLAIQGAVGSGDAPTVQAVVVVATVVVVIVNLLLELASSFLDPKLRAS
jgi:peptide/nickel transport system permease protein